MRLFTSKASKSSKPRVTTLRGGRGYDRLNAVGGGRGCSASRRDSIFEPLEARQMFSASTTTITHTTVDPTPVIIHPTPVLTPSQAAIAAEYKATAKETDVNGNNLQKELGSATSAVVADPNIAGAFMQSYHDTGVIYYSASTGAHVIYGHIETEYAATADEVTIDYVPLQQTIGLPTSDETAIAGVSGGMSAHLKGGSIYWSGSTGAHLVYSALGSIYTQYNSNGGPSGWLGLPTSDEFGYPSKSIEMTFQYGNIIWTPKGGAVVHNDGVTVTTRFGGTEVDVTASGSDDNVSVTQSGKTLTIIGDHEPFTEPVTSGGLFIFTRGGNDHVTIGSSVTALTTLETIDGAVTHINCSDPSALVWCDSNDVVTGKCQLHRVASFADGVSKAVGASMPSPSDSGPMFTANLSLFGSGPVMADVNQHAAGDCWFLAALCGIVQADPNLVLNSAVDMGDGTYAVEFYNSGTPVYLRVNNHFSVGNFDGYQFAHPGPNDTIWGPILEKALCYFRSGANTYASISGGYPTETYADFNLLSINSSTGSWPSSDSVIYSHMQEDLAIGVVINLDTPSSPPQLAGNHVYDLVSVKTVKGVHEYVVRNPWGFDSQGNGDTLVNNQGFATLTYAQVVANFDELDYATI